METVSTFGIIGRPEAVDAGLVCVHDFEIGSDTFEEVVHETTIMALVDDLIDAYQCIGGETGKVTDKEGVLVMKMVRQKLIEAVDRINVAIDDKQEVIK